MSRKHRAAAVRPDMRLSTRCCIRICSSIASKPRRITNRVCFTIRVSTQSRSCMTVLVSSERDWRTRNPGCHHQLPYSGGTTRYSADWHHDDHSSHKNYNSCVIHRLSRGPGDSLLFSTIDKYMFIDINIFNLLSCLFQYCCSRRLAIIILKLTFPSPQLVRESIPRFCHLFRCKETNR